MTTRTAALRDKGCAAERLQALIHVAAYGSLRRSELTGLAWANVDLTERRVHVRQAQTR